MTTSLGVGRGPRTAIVAIFAMLAFAGCRESATEHIVSADRSGNPIVGCQSRQYYETIVRRASQDPKAFRRVMLSGDCVVLAPTAWSARNGTSQAVYVVERTWFSSLVKVRRRGELVEYWTASSAVLTPAEAYERALREIRQETRDD